MNDASLDMDEVLKVTKIWSGGVTDTQFLYREWVLNMNIM